MAKSTPSSDQLARMAIAGDIEGLFGLMDGEPDGDRDVLAYKWLAVASDFGHEEADDAIDDLLEASSLRFDDDQFLTGNAHWELGLAYLGGRDGLPRDLDRAREQLLAAQDRHYPVSIADGDKMLADLRRGLPADALAVVDAIYDGRPTDEDDED